MEHAVGAQAGWVQTSRVPRRGPIAALAVLALVATLLVAAPPTSAADEPASAVAAVVDTAGDRIGTVNFFDAEVVGLEGTLVYAEVEGLPGGGFHGFHVHAVGECDPDFGGAGGHFNPTGDPHGEHAGDMPVLYATDDGVATSVFITDRFAVEDLLGSEDGTAVIIHADPDNSANIPDRYVSTTEDDEDYDRGPDSATLAHGDAGARIACGVIEEGEGDVPEVPEFSRAATAEMVGVEGEVLFAEIGDGGVLVLAAIEGLPGGGIHGFHVHGTGECDGDFSSAGGHFNPGGDRHHAHAGDMVTLIATDDGFALGAFVTDRFSVTELLEREQGAAVIVHANPDNFANIPDRYVSTTEQAEDYQSGPDHATLAHGDAGPRIGCGVVEPYGESLRVHGDDRIETAIEISQEQYPETGTAGTVLLTRDDDFADALAGTPLAVALDGPTLLTPSRQLDERTRDEIDRLLGGTGVVHILGGLTAVAPAVADELTEAGYEVERVAGDDRYETAVEIAGALGDPETVLIVRGADFPDAVAAGAAAAHVDGAVLLTTDESSHPTTNAYLDEHRPEEMYAVGGPAARAYPGMTPVAGDDRFETTRLVAATFFDEPLHVGLARSDAFPDALTGGVLAGSLGAPMLITPPTVLHGQVEAYLCENAVSLGFVVAFGGEAAISVDVLDRAADRIAARGC